MAINVGNGLNFQKTEALNMIIQVVASDPESGLAEGWFIYNSTDKALKYYNGTAWVALGTAEGIVDVIGTSPINVTGTTSKTVSIDPATGDDPGSMSAAHYTLLANFDTEVTSFRLDEFADPTASVSLNSQRIINLGTPTDATDAATKGYVDASVQGLDIKGSVRVAVSTDVTVSNPGTSSLGGETLSNGDRVLLMGQSTASQNGIYVFNGSSSALTRALDANADAEVTPGMYVYVEEGTFGANGYVLTTEGPITLGSTSLVFTQFTGAGQITAGNGLTKSGNTLAVGAGTGITVNADDIQISASYVGQTSITTLGTITTGVWNGTAIAVGYGGTGITSYTTGNYVRAASSSALEQRTPAQVRGDIGATTKYSTTIGNGSNTSFTVTHNLGTRDVTVAIYETGSPYAVVITDVEHTTTNTLTVTFAAAPSNNQYTVVVIG